MDSIEKEFVPYDPALRLKVLGFDEPCLVFYLDNDKESFTKCIERADTNAWLKEHMKVYGDSTTAPLFQQAFRWFREKYGLFAEITLWGDGLGYTSMIKEIKQEEFIEVYQKAIVDTGLPIWVYEKAELACLIKLIEIVESKTK